VPGREKTKDRIKKGMMKAKLSTRLDDRMPAHHPVMGEAWAVLVESSYQL
jgi:hypothetical protein